MSKKRRATDISAILNLAWRQHLAKLKAVLEQVGEAAPLIEFAVSNRVNCEIFRKCVKRMKYLFDG